MTLPVVVIAGPTASGKSNLALALAERFDGLVVNADSMQLYHELDILTDRPGPEALARAPHVLYGVVSAAEACSVGRWRKMASAEIERAARESRMAIVTGGTGLYIRALINGLAVIPEIPPAIRRAARARLAAVGTAEFHAELARRDPRMAARLRDTDRQRLVRAWEVREATGRSLAEWQDAPDEAPPAAWRFFTLRLIPPREDVYAACDDRFDRMIERGAVEEARALAGLDLDPGLPAMKAVGVPPLIRHIAGDIPFEEARRLAQRDTRRFARRQMTWFRNQLTSTLSLSEQYSERLNSKIFPLISNFLLTTER
jgi:tRNA dimethylallyltransferase